MFSKVDVDDDTDDKDDKTENSCLMMLNIFSSRRHGQQSSDIKLPRSIRLSMCVS